MKRRTVFSVLSLVFTLLVFAYVALHLNWTLALAHLSAAHPGWLAAAFAFFILNYFLRTLRFHLLIHDPRVLLRRLMGVTSLYGMFNYLLPAKSGELTYVLLLNRCLRVGLADSTATLVTARFFDFGVVALCLPFVLAVFFDQLPDWLIQSSIVYCVLVALAGGLVVVWLRTGRFRTTDESTKNKLRRAVSKLVDGLRTIDDRRQYWPLWLLSLLIWGCVYTNLYLIVLSIGFAPTLVQMIVVSIILVPLTLLPVQGLANVGTHEVGWVAAYSLFGYSPELALAIAVTTHVVLFVFVLLLGALGSILLRMDKRLPREP